MLYKKFNATDVIQNTLITKPYYEFRVFNGTSSLNNSSPYIKFNELNITGSGSNYSLYIDKTSDNYSFKNVIKDEWFRTEPGERITSSYPFSSSIDIKFVHKSTDPQCNSYATTVSLSDGSEIEQLTSQRIKIKALKNVLNNYSNISPHYSYNSEFGNKETQDITIINIPAIIYGSCLNKGTVNLEFYITGTLAARIEDNKLNGELTETTGSNTGSCAGVVLYNEGIILLTGSWTIADNTDIYTYCPETASVSPKWIYWGASDKENPSYTVSSSFRLNFETTNKVQTTTYFTHAGIGEFNHSNNPTIIKYGTNTSSYYSSSSYIENDSSEIIDLHSASYRDTTDFERITYISKIGIYDKNKNLIGIAKTKVPLVKKPKRSYTIKIKLDQ